MSADKSIHKDFDFSRLVVSGDDEACRRFVADHSDLVLGRIWHLMKAHCTYSPMEYTCCLLVLQTTTKQSSASDCRTQCDECMDSYLWCFEYLKTRLKAYQGRNNCSLKTYVWSVINSQTMYVDWLRWRYGRAF